MNAKKALLVLVVVFLGFWMFTDPQGPRGSGAGRRRADMEPRRAAVQRGHRLRRRPDLSGRPGWECFVAILTSPVTCSATRAK